MQIQTSIIKSKSTNKIIARAAEKVWRNLSGSKKKGILSEGKAFFKLHQKGMPREDIREQIGVDQTTLKIWAQEARCSDFPLLDELFFRYRFLCRVLVWKQFCKLMRKTNGNGRKNGKVVKV